MSFKPAQNIVAHAFHDRFEGGRTSGILIFQAHAIIFRWDLGEIDFPSTGLSLRLGGASDRLIFIEHASRPGWSVYTTDHGLIAHPDLLRHHALSAQIAKIKRKKSTHWVAFGLLVVIALALIGGLFLAKDLMVKAIAGQVPIEWEVKLGKAALDQYAKANPYIQDPALDETLAQVLAPLVDSIPDKRYQFNFYIVPDETLNAAAFPGGAVIIHTQTILAADRPEELLGVLAHEIAHVNHRHGIKAIVNSLGVLVLVRLVLGDAGSLGVLLMNATPYLLNQKFSRDNEREADEAGFTYLREAGIDPSGMTDFFVKVQQSMSPTTAGMEKPLAFLNSHPTTDERIAGLRAKVAAAEPNIHIDVSAAFRQLKSQVAAWQEFQEPKDKEAKDGTHEN